MESGKICRTPFAFLKSADSRSSQQLDGSSAQQLVAADSHLHCSASASMAAGHVPSNHTAVIAAADSRVNTGSKQVNCCEVCKSSKVVH